MDIPQNIIEDLDKKFWNPDSIEWLSDLVMQEYNELMNKIMDRLDADDYLSYSEQHQQVQWELVSFLEQIQSGVKRKKTFFAGFFSSNEKSYWDTSEWTNMRDKIEWVMDAYSSSLRSLTTSCSVVKELYDWTLDYIQKLEYIVIYFNDKIQGMEWADPISLAIIETFVNNMNKLLMQLKQKKMILSGSLKNYIGLRWQMSIGESLFRWQLANIMIETSAEKVARDCIDLMALFRDTIEHHQHSTALNVIETAKDVANERNNSVVSVWFLETMSQTIKAWVDVQQKLVLNAAKKDQKAKETLERLWTQLDEREKKSLSLPNHNGKETESTTDWDSI